MTSTLDNPSARINRSPTCGFGGRNVQKQEYCNCHKHKHCELKTFIRPFIHSFIHLYATKNSYIENNQEVQSSRLKLLLVMTNINIVKPCMIITIFTVQLDCQIAIVLCTLFLENISHENAQDVSISSAGGCLKI